MFLMVCLGRLGKTKAGGRLIEKHGIALNPMEVVGVRSVIPFPNAMCRVDPIASGDLEFVPGGGEGMPEIKPLIPITPSWSFARELEHG
jgi:hypothetical protein